MPAWKSAPGQSIFIDGDVTYFVSEAKTITVAHTLDSRYDDVGGVLTKAGNGTLVLTGFNYYTGDTNIQAGTLRVTRSISGSRSVNLAAGATW